MKRFIRLKNGKIIDFQEKYEELISLNAICKTKQEFNKRQKQGLRSIYYSEQYKTLYVFEYGGFYMLDIVKQADYIEDLIEAIIWNNKIVDFEVKESTKTIDVYHNIKKPIRITKMYIPFDEDADELCYLTEISNNNSDNLKRLFASSKSGVYGAVWTDKGLIYIEKMNKKGEWELI